jgi:hypothetical protein
MPTKKQITKIVPNPSITLSLYSAISNDFEIAAKLLNIKHNASHTSHGIRYLELRCNERKERKEIERN